MNTLEPNYGNALESLLYGLVLPVCEPKRTEVFEVIKGHYELVADSKGMTFDDVAKHFWIELSRVMEERGCPVAILLRDGDLADALDHYTNPDHPEYDADFDACIRAIRPDWFGKSDEGPGETAAWIDYQLVWDTDAQDHFLREWHDHLIHLGLNPVTQRDLCLSLVFKRVNRIPGDD